VSDFVKALTRVFDAERRKQEGNPSPVAMCPSCRDEPLVFTFERAGFEFTCVHCGGWYEFLAPVAAERTPELEAKIAANKETYRHERQLRIDRAIH
jgi:hypothetical protein